MSLTTADERVLEHSRGVVRPGDFGSVLGEDRPGALGSMARRHPVGRKRYATEASVRAAARSEARAAPLQDWPSWSDIACCAISPMSRWEYASKPSFAIRACLAVSPTHAATTLAGPASRLSPLWRRPSCNLLVRSSVAACGAWLRKRDAERKADDGEVEELADGDGEEAQPPAEEDDHMARTSRLGAPPSMTTAVGAGAVVVMSAPSLKSGAGWARGASECNNPAR